MKDNIWGVDPVDTKFYQLNVNVLIKYFKIFWFSKKNLISIFSKYVWVTPLNKEKAITMTNAFPKVLAESNRKPNKIWVDKRHGLYNRLIRCWPTLLAYLEDLLIKIV